MRVDKERLSVEHRAVSRVMPEASTMRAAALGQQTLLADLMWIRVALSFADLIDHPDADGNRWLGTLLTSIAALDPGWRTPYFYGGSMMRVLGDIDSSDAVFAAGMRDLPQDPYFPFSLGMNAYLYREDPKAASDYLHQAAELPSAPRWYKAAAAGFLDEHGQREAALEYLDAQMRLEEEPGARAALQTKYNLVLHDKLAAELDLRLDAWEEEQGRELDTLGELGELPPDPLGRGWVLAPDHQIRSLAEEEKLAGRLQRRERDMLLFPP